MKYSIIVPVYNRPDECDELLSSLCQQTYGEPFEVIIVEDGSSVPCHDVVSRYEGRLDVHYYNKPNSGPGQTRNYGVERATGEYVLILDSDVVLPPGYLVAVDQELAALTHDERQRLASFGGPDKAHPSFTPVQKAINYGMTSFFTTGGIRGGKAKLDKFFPRSFNMGVRRDTYLQLGGFSKMRFGEDVDFSYRIVEAGYGSRLFPSAWVYHKRRTDLRKFFKQVHNSGIARINLTKRHPGTLKLVHLLPAVFTIGVALCLLCLLFWLLTLCCTPLHEATGCLGNILGIFGGGCLLAYALLIMCGATLQERSLRVGLLAIAAAYVQLCGYGTGFLRCWWLRCVRGRNEELQAFRDNFYK